MNIKDLDFLPITPGVYKFYNRDGTILYIGKAINLRNRVKSYFTDTLFDRPYVKQMIPYIDKVEVVKTNNEIESLVLESALIKEYNPKYNSEKKDDKSYSWIYISTSDDFPTVRIVRKISFLELKRGQLFGPYPSGLSIKRVFTYLRKLYPFCTCKKASSKECMYFHLGMCPGPYQGHISKEKYRENINEIIKFLKGRKRGQLSKLEKEMNDYSKERKYERAALLRDRIRDLKYLGEKIDFEYGDNEESYVERRRKILKENFHDLRIELGLDKLNRIECYDISNIQGELAYASMTVAQEGEIKASEYRIFKIKTIDTPNDPVMLREALSRRFDSKNIDKYISNPDIVLIDGGKSQLNVVKDVIPQNIALLGISKGKRLKRKGGKLLDEFWYLDRSTDEVRSVKILNKSLLIDLRDEAHRFAILHHRKARLKQKRMSELSNISGVGRKSRIRLMKKYKSIDNIKRLSLDELNDILKNKRISKLIFEYFNK